MTNENINLKKQLLDYLSKNNIVIPDDILAHIDKVFEDFEFDDTDDEAVNIYFKEDSELFENDLTITNVNAINITGPSTGTYKGTYTYTENLDYIINEKTDLMFNGEIVETLVDIHSDERTLLDSEVDWAVVVVETINYGEGDYTRTPKLYVYIPVEGEAVE